MRFRWLGIAAAVLLVPAIDGRCQRPADDSAAAKKGSRAMSDDSGPAKLPKTDAQWRAVLSPQQYQVTRKHGTEPAFTGQYWNCHKAGVYRCVCCGAVLFSSETKFDSGTGWPSFFAPLAKDAVSTTVDRSHGMRRIEVHCSHCGAHLGHVFDDGPQPTGLRYCTNSVSLKLEEEKSPAETKGK
jgi:peptide-methionine (R)-S-oxide reductase